MNSALAVVGRFLLSGIFFVSAWRKFEDPGAVAKRIATVTASTPWVPDAVAVGVRDAAPLLAWTAIVLEVLGAFCLATGFRKESGAMLLVLYLVPVTLLFHPPNDPAQLTQFLKNAAILGGLLVVAADGSRREDVRG